MPDSFLQVGDDQCRQYKFASATSWISIPDECTWGEVMNSIYVRQKIESRLTHESVGITVPHDEVFKKYQNDAS